MESTLSPEKKEFFDTVHKQGLALTYDDVRLRTGPSDVSPGEVDISTRFSRNISMKSPLVSAAMDTVTESKMAILIAKEFGGLGVIHAGLDINEQRKEARRVKLHRNGLIENPIHFSPDRTLLSIENERQDNGWDFQSFPIVDEQKRVLGILTSHHFKYTRDMSSVTAEEKMTPASEMVFARPGTSLNEAYNIMLKNEVGVLVLADDEMKLDGIYIWSDVKSLEEDDVERQNLDDKGRLRVAIAVPTDPQEAVRRVEACGEYIDVAVIDSAHGDSKYAQETLVALKKEYPSLDVVAGNISEPISARKLAELGADGIKVGQGPGSICTTRPETGIGHPQVSAVWNCVRAVEEFDIPVCADGGISNFGDISIAIGASRAESVMLGGLLGGTKEAPGEIITRDGGGMVKLYRGMGSPGALRDSAASRKRYSAEGMGKPLSEGVEKYVPYKGSAYDVLDHCVKALRKSMSYVGARDIESHRNNTGVIRITNAGLRESHPHDVSV